MKALSRAGQNLAVLFLGTMAGSVGFALLLGLAWLPALSRSVAYKVTTLLLVAALALVIAGWVAGLMVRHGQVRHGAVLGLFFGCLFFGCLTFGYMFGPQPVLLLTVPLTGLLAAGGGWLAARQLQAVTRGP
jgi:hypothetical protein